MRRFHEAFEQWVSVELWRRLLRFVKQILWSVLVPAAAASGQLSGGFGPLGQVSSAASTWRSAAALSGVARFDQPLATVSAEGAFLRTADGSFFGDGAARGEFFTPTLGGIRGVSSIHFQQRSALDPLGKAALAGTFSLSYAQGVTGGWLGVRAGSAGGFRFGGWRQVADWLTVSISSSLRRAAVAGTPPRFWTEPVYDSIWTDTAGWERWQVGERTFGDSGTLGHKLRWLETEARLGWTVGRVALDGVIGWRPPLDTTQASTWFRGTGSVAVARNVALSFGYGSTTTRLPFTRQTGRFGTLGLRLAPAALLRPNDTPEITPAASSFALERADNQYIVRVRLPRARVVELSGDFNGWQPVRLARDLDNSWVIALDLKPGAYRMNLRVDGDRWLPPPGTTAVDDEFNGKVGLVVVR